MTTPTIKIVTLGAIQHGKTYLTGALQKYCSPPSAQTNYDLAQIQAVSLEPPVYTVNYSFNERIYSHIDPGSRSDPIDSLIQDTPIDGAILVVSLTEGPMPLTKKHVAWARKAGIPSIIVFLNKVDTLPDPDLIELAELETRELLNIQKYPGDDTPFIIGSALEAFNKDPGERSTGAIKKLLEAMDAWIQPSTG